MLFYSFPLLAIFFSYLIIEMICKSNSNTMKINKHVMSSVHSSAEQGQEVLPCSSPLAVKRFSEERVSMRRSVKVTFLHYFVSDCLIQHHILPAYCTGRSCDLMFDMYHKCSWTLAHLCCTLFCVPTFPVCPVYCIFSTHTCQIKAVL